MLGRRLFVSALVVLVAGVVSPGLVGLGRAQAADTLPTRLTDEEFWRLSEALSEPGGAFRSDNLLSNELYFGEVLAELVSRAKPGGVYLGVGPEQNFHYIVATKPKMVFITDIRRGNLHTQLMYKALVELSADRAEFVSRLFSKPRPPGLTASTSASDLMQAFWTVESGPQAVFEANFTAVVDHLTKAPHTLSLSADDLEGIKYVYNSFYWFGPSITYNSSQGGGRGGSMTNYAQLMMAVDPGGVSVSFLANEEHFRFLKDIERRNMVVPVVGNFGGAKALRAIGQYVREHGASVSAFYLSNVEQYLRQDGIWGAFCANVASMPLTAESTFIRSQSGGGGGVFSNTLALMLPETAPCRAPAGVGADR